MAMPLNLGASAYMAWKKQTAFGTKASLTSGATLACPRPEGSIFRPRPYRVNRSDHTNITLRTAELYNIPKLVDWGCSLFFYQDVTVIDWLTAAFGTEVRVGVGSPFTHQWYVANPVYDGGTDPGPGAGTYFGRAMTIGHTMDDNDYGFEIESAVVDQLSIVFEQSACAILNVSGVGTNLVKQASPAAFAMPGSPAFTWEHIQSAAGPPTSGIFAISAASPGTPAQATNQLIANKMTFSLDNHLLIQPMIGLASSQYVRKPERDGQPTMQIEIEMLADQGTGGATMNSVTIFDSFINGEFVNLVGKASAATNDILEINFSKTGAKGAGIFRDPEQSYNGEGVMRMRAVMDVMLDAPSTDGFIKLTSDVS